MKCKVCNKRFKLLSNKKYLVEVNGGSLFQPLKEIYEAFDCPKCGCQNIVNTRKNNIVGEIFD